MKLNLSYPGTGLQKTIDVDDENKVRCFFGKKMTEEVELDSVGDQFKGYVVKVVGGQDKQGFPMMEGVLVNTRVRLLIKGGAVGFAGWRSKKGQRKRRSVRGCICDHDLSVIQCVITKKGDEDIPGLTTDVKPKALPPKRASKIRKLFDLSKHDDVREYVITHTKTLAGKEVKVGPKIQRLVTPTRLRRKNQLKRLRLNRLRTRARNERKYKELLASRNKN